jgi:hypothetical protein
MQTRRLLSPLAVFVAAVLSFGLLGCDSGGSSMDDEPGDGPKDEPTNTFDVTITVTNVGSSAYRVSEVSGASGVAQTDTDNPSLTLTVGTRYRVDNNAGINAHPFAFQNAADEYLLRQESGETGSREGDSEINYVEDDEGITFTYTQSLADAVASYRCTFHSSMEGDVTTSDTGSGY